MSTHQTWLMEEEQIKDIDAEIKKASQELQDSLENSSKSQDLPEHKQDKQSTPEQPDSSSEDYESNVTMSEYQKLSDKQKEKYGL